MGCFNSGLQSYQKWTIGNDIRNMMLADEDIESQVKDKIFPIIAPENTNGDFIIYKREQYGKKTVKNGVYEDECTVAVIGISDNYDSAVALASKIDNALTGRHTLENGVKLNIMLQDSTEEFTDNKYVETLLFNIN